MKTEVVYLNGSLVPREEAFVNVYDGAFLHGAGLFETMLAQAGRVFRLESHMARLQKSAAHLLRPIDRDTLPSASALVELLEANGLRDARVRMTVSSGDVSQPEPEDESLFTVCVTVTKPTIYPPQLYETGVRVAICNYRQAVDDPTAGHKITGYLPRLLGLRDARRAKCMEAIWFNVRNELAEGSISSVFLVSGGILKTPPLNTPVLPGITREGVLELAVEAKIETAETVLTINDLLDADEVFLTNSSMQVMPVVRVEARGIGDGKVGPITRRMRETYRDLVRKECGGL